MTKRYRLHLHYFLVIWSLICSCNPQEVQHKSLSSFGADLVDMETSIPYPDMEQDTDINTTRRVTTELGGLLGSTEETSYGPSISFKGVPYAEPPVAELRFKPPRSVDSWEGVREALNYGPSCPQSGPLFTPVDLVDEDCLNLNIWVPASADGKQIRHGDPRAVMVWIHGGGFIQGSGSFSLYNGARLATRGDVIVVTLNYRLGVFGFLNTRRLLRTANGEDFELDEKPTLTQARQVGNFGIQDQIHALKWIRNHIAAFGGDPDKVTIFGESAGGFSICALLATPLAEGLFHRAIIESGGGCHGFDDLGTDEQSDVEQSASRILAFLGCEDLVGQDLHDCLEALSTDEIVESTEAAGESILGLDQMGPSTDGVVIPGRPDLLIKNGEVYAPNILIGSNADEMTLFTFNMFISLESYDQFVQFAFGLLANRILNLYPADNNQEARQAYNTLLADLIFICPSVKFASTLTAADSQYGQNVWVYHFMHQLRNGLIAPLGATHALEIPFVFNNYHMDFYGTVANREDRQLSDQMSDAWIQFAKTGDPSTDELPWPYYRAVGDDGPVDQGVIMRWQTEPNANLAPFREGRCHKLDELNLLQR